jgi:acetyltransferase-like isoleucine patch superfamily enzyme
MNEPLRRLEHDWYPGVIPANVALGPDVYVDTSYAFGAFHSRREAGLAVGAAAGIYDRTNFFVGPAGQVVVGPYTCLNATTVVCNDRVVIGAHCFLAWGVVLTDSWPGPGVPLAARRAALRAAAADPRRHFPRVSTPRPIVLGDNVWVGFDSVILPGVSLGQGCVVGCKTVVAADIPPYAVVVGTPPRVVRVLDPDDDEAARERARRECARALPAGLGGTRR